MIRRMILAGLLLVLLGRYIPMEFRDRYDLHGMRFYAAVLLTMLAVEAIYVIVRRRRMMKRMRPQVTHIHHYGSDEPYDDPQGRTIPSRRLNNGPQGPRAAQ